METKLVKGNWSYNHLVEDCGEAFAKKYAKWFNAQVDREEAFFKLVSSETVMNQLFDLINETFGFGEVCYDFEVVDSREGKAIKFKSENLSRKSVFINAAWEEFYVSCFNYGHTWMELFPKEGAEELHYGGYEEKDIDMTKEPKIGFSMDIHFTYSSWSGGSNGSEIGYAFFDGNHWTIQTEKGRALDRKREDFERQLEWESRIPDGETA